MEPQLTLLSTPKAVAFGGKPVEPTLVRRAEAVLEDFNRQTRSRLSPYKGDGNPSDALTRILGAVLAFPDVTGADWHRAIEVALEQPWWSGRPSVGVVFGPKVVEKYLFGPERPIESADARQRRERAQRRARQRSILAKLRGGAIDDSGGVGGHLPAS